MQFHCWPLARFGSGGHTGAEGDAVPVTDGVADAVTDGVLVTVAVTDGVPV